MAPTIDPDTLRERVDAARATFHGGRPDGAVRQYDALRRELATAHRDEPLLGLQYARVLIGLAASVFEVSGELDRAMALLDEAERTAVENGPAGLTATIRGQRGVLLLRAGRTRQALVALDDAVALIDTAAPADQMMMLLNRGTLNMERGALPGADADFRRCVDIAAQCGDRELELRARHNLGYAEFLAGRIPRALATMDRAEQLNDGPPHPIGMLDRARVLREAGLVSDAERLLASAVELFGSGRLHQDVAEAQLARAECALVEGETERARRLATTAERLFARRGNLRWRRRAELLVLRCERRAADGRSGARRDAALRVVVTRAHRLAGSCRAEHRLDLARPAELLALECELLLGLAAPDLPLPQMRSTDPLQARLQTREVRALAALHRGEPVRAAAEVRHGLSELGSYQNSFGSLDLRTASAVHGLPLARLGLEAAARSGSAADFFAAVERGRAISTRLAPIGPPRDARTADLLADLRRSQEEARVLAGDAGAAEELARLRTRSTGLRREIRARSWELEGGAEGPVAESARLGEVRAAARAAGTAFVTYVVHGGRWRAVVASRSRPHLVDLAGVAEVEELVQRVRADLDALAMPVLPAPLVDAVRRSLDAGLRRLDDLLLEPLGLAGTPLVVSASTVLVLLPWSLLPSRRGLPVVVTPSATSWLRAGRHSRPPTPRVVSVAGPGLRRAEEEADRVQARWPDAQRLTAGAATTGAVRDALARADLVHVAGHGTHQQESPLFSSLRLADGPLYAYELDGGSAPCVVLSACEAGLATVRPGDEGLGLTSVLLHLGSRSVLAGVARVPDDVADRVMDRVHAAMVTGTDSAQALAWALAEDDQLAPFVCFGSSW
ncbi:MAG: CHAT domain-containing protein [Nocardioidaceae bacterium]